MAPPLCLPSPTLGKWGSVCLLFCRAACPVYHCHSTETHRKEWSDGEWRWGSSVQSVLLWALRPRAPRGECSTPDPYISISAFRAPTAFVSAHSGCQDMCLRLLTGAWVQVLTRQWQEIWDSQWLTSQRPTHAPAWPLALLWTQG